MDKLLKVTPEEFKQARNTYERNDGASGVSEDLEILRKWLEKQPHLPQKHDNGRLERFLLKNKFRMEQTKIKQEAYYTLRGTYTDLFRAVDPFSEAFVNIRKALVWVPMPNLTPKLERLVIFKIIEKQCEHYNLSDWVCYVLTILDLCLTYDYALSDRLVMDFEGFSLQHLARLDPKVLYEGVLLHQEAYSGRLSGLEIINGPPFINIFLSMLKVVFKPKLFGKITLHKTLDSLYEKVPIEYLPVEFGGEQQSYMSLHDEWGREITKHRDFLLENAAKVTNESLRVVDVTTTEKGEIFGNKGTFRKINVD